MAAGAIVLAHDSGGPKLDIVVEHDGKKTGFLASDVESYASCLNTVFSLDDKTLTDNQRNARESVKRFSDAQFSETFLHVTEHLILPAYWILATYVIYHWHIRRTAIAALQSYAFLCHNEILKYLMKINVM